MTRAILAVAAGLLCGVAGFRRSAALKADAIRLQRLTEILQRLSLILDEQTVSLPAALCLAADEGTSADMLLQRIAAAVRSNPLLSLPEAFGQELPECIESETLLRLAARLGRGSADSRRQAVDHAAALLAQMAAAAQEHSAKDVKLWSTLGWTGGLCLTLLLI